MGSHLARMLSGNGHDITIIDSDQKLLSEVGSLADVITVEGDSTTFAVLREASVRKCDLFIAVNHEENDNVVAAMLGQEARGQEIHRPHRQQRIPRTQQQGDVHRHGHRLPVLPREGRGPRGDQPAGTHFDHGVRRFFERQTLARGFPPRTGLAAGGGGAHGLRRRPGPVELPHGGHHARRADDHSARGRTVHGGRRDLCHRASGRRAGGDGVFGSVEHRDQEHDDPRRFAHRHPHRHRVAGRGEHQTDRLQRREGLPAGRSTRR